MAAAAKAAAPSLAPAVEQSAASGPGPSEMDCETLLQALLKGATAHQQQGLACASWATSDADTRLPLAPAASTSTAGDSADTHSAQPRSPAGLAAAPHSAPAGAVLAPSESGKPLPHTAADMRAASPRPGMRQAAPAATCAASPDPNAPAGAAPDTDRAAAAAAWPMPPHPHRHMPQLTALLRKIVANKQQVAACVRDAAALLEPVSAGQQQPAGTGDANATPAAAGTPPLKRTRERSPGVAANDAAAATEGDAAGRPAKQQRLADDGAAAGGESGMPASPAAASCVGGLNGDNRTSSFNANNQKYATDGGPEGNGTAACEGSSTAAAAREEAMAMVLKSTLAALLQSQSHCKALASLFVPYAAASHVACHRALAVTQQAAPAAAGTHQLVQALQQQRAAARATQLAAQQHLAQLQQELHVANAARVAEHQRVGMGVRRLLAVAGTAGLRTNEKQQLVAVAADMLNAVL